MEKKKGLFNISQTTTLWKKRRKSLYLIVIQQHYEKTQLSIFVLFTGSVLELLFEKLECLSEKILAIVKLLKFNFVN